MPVSHPDPLRPGDVVAVVAPASPVDPSRMTAGISVLRSWGLRPRLGSNVFHRSVGGYLAGTDMERARDLMDAWSDPEVRGIFCARGGYGCQRLLDLLDYEVMAANPKVFVGSSDATALHVALWRYAHLSTFYGPMVEHNWTKTSAAAQMRAVMGPAGKPAGVRPGGAMIDVVERGAPVVGGNLSLLASLAGTKYALAADDCVLFLEDIGERPYSVDRLLWQLSASGAFSALSGVLIGSFERRRMDQPREDQAAVVRVVAEHFERRGIPIWIAPEYGHQADALTLPLGWPVRVR